MKLLKLVPYMLIVTFAFYFLPSLITDTGSAMFIMLITIPLITLICSISHGIRRGFNIFLPIITVLLFVPSFFIFYNTSAWIYIPIYGLISLIGNLFGRIFHKMG